MRSLRLLAAALILALSAAPAAAPADAAAKKPRKVTKKHCTKKAVARVKGKKAKARRKQACRRLRAQGKPKQPAPPVKATAPAPRVEGGADDAVVVAVLDGGVNPYHWDFLASKMPNAGAFPLDRPATEWLDGYGAAAQQFKSFSRVDLTLQANDPDESSDFLFDGDKPAWEQVKQSGEGGLHGAWFPGTKVIGALDFSDDGLYEGVDAHGVGTTSSSVGNIHGTCPECLLFFIDIGHTAASAERADEWAQAQPWIDVISHSYGHGGTAPKIYAKSDTNAQRRATERGQTLVWSAGNGFENGYVVTNPTTYSSQKGPDWLITVGASSPGEENHYGDDSGGGSFFGAGKPVDVSGVGSSYPNAYTASSVGGTGRSGFGGTSNASPTVAGLYSRALYLSRRALAGPSRTQAGDVIATGAPVACGAARPDCELGDGRLTATELRTRVLHGAVHTEAGLADPLPLTTTPSAAEQEFLTEGHGTYFARQAGPGSSAWLEEFDRILAPMEGRVQPLERPEGEAEWFIVDSYCRQRNWGSWRGGAFVEGQTQLPAPDPRYPFRGAWAQSCPGGPTPGA